MRHAGGACFDEPMGLDHAAEQGKNAGLCRQLDDQKLCQMSLVGEYRGGRGHLEGNRTSFLEDLLFQRTESASSLSCLDDSVADGAFNSPINTMCRSHDGTMAVNHRQQDHEPATCRSIPATSKSENRTPYKLADLVELLPGRLAYAVHESDEQSIQQISDHPGRFYFSSELHERYESFALDFGPVNLCTLHEFCTLLHSRVMDPRLRKRQIVYYSGDSAEDRSNTAFLLAAYLVIMHDKTPEEACTCFDVLGLGLIGFRDATFREADFQLSLYDLLQGLKAAMSLGWYDHDTFNEEEYSFLDHPRNGDMHEVVPGRFLAFKGPDEREGMKTVPIQQYTAKFLEKGVKAVIRLNEPDAYDPRVFTEHGINHYECYFDDCSVPPPSLVKRFMDICDKEQGLVAVHCLAGLGRTGTLIALWMMRTHRLKARECISWLRICRPGSVIGPQQQYLVSCDDAKWQVDNTMMRSLASFASLPSGSATGSCSSLVLAKQVTDAFRRRDELRRSGPR